jgi:hypothetical protein
MKRGRFSEEQIVGILKEHEAGRKTEIFLGLEARTISLHLHRLEQTETSASQSFHLATRL